MDFYQALEERRSIYVTTKESPIPNDEIIEIIKKIANVSPSSFNSQSSRVLVLFGEKHTAFWKIVLKELKKITPKENFADTKAKIEMLSTSTGTILFYENQWIVQNLQKAFPIYKNSFPIWAEHSSAMLQFAIWTALEEKGLGATLQHYNPIIDVAVAKEFNIPKDWKLIAQMPFGGISVKPEEIEHLPIEEKVFVRQ